MSKEDKINRIEFIVACVSEFANKFHMSYAEAYFYLRRFSGIELLLKHYESIHTLSFVQIIDDLQTLCQRKGGEVA